MRLQNFRIFILVLLIACKSKTDNTISVKPLSLDSLLKRHENCILNGEPPFFDSSKYEGAWNAAYAYDFLYPKSFKYKSIEILDKDGAIISDTSVYISPNRHAIIKFWIGETIFMPQDNIKVDDILRVDKKIDSLIFTLRKGNYPYLENFILDTLCHGVDGYYQDIAFIAHNDRQVSIYKIEYSILPISGDLIAKNLVFTYDKEYANIYHSVGITIANSFGFAKFDK
jgi:hypothetical protein